MQKRSILAAVAVTTGLVLAGTGGAIAANQIGSAGIKNDSVKSIDVKNGTLRPVDLRPSMVESFTADTDALGGAFYAQAVYDVGNTNAGAVATVACSADPADTDYVAISGGVQTLGLDDTPLNNNTPVASSFPGRMDWSTNTPRPDRLDGWIVQFGGNAGATSDNPPERVVVWALCVAGLDTPVQETFNQ